MITSARVGLDVLVVSCATSAGIHAALVPDHVSDGTGPALGFALASALLASLVVGLTLRPASAIAVAGAGALLAGLLVSYAFAATTGLPLLHPDVEPIDRLALATKAIEIVGLLAAVHLLRHGHRAGAATHLQSKGSLT